MYEEGPAVGMVPDHLTRLRLVHGLSVHLQAHHLWCKDTLQFMMLTLFQGMSKLLLHQLLQYLTTRSPR